MARCTACAGRLRKATLYKKACVYGFHKPRMTNVQTLRSRTRGCETRFGPNWAWSKGSKCTKMNVVKIGDLNRDSRRPAQPLFISTTCGFDLEKLGVRSSVDVPIWMWMESLGIRSRSGVPL